MSEYDPRCLNCFHKSHEGKDCPYCPLPTKENPNARCREYARADIYIGRAVARMEQFFGQSHGQIIMAMSTIFDLLAEAYPEAAERLQKKLEERQKASEAAMEEQRLAREKEAAEALEAAKKADEERAMEELVEQYTDNVVPFRKPEGPEEE